MFGRRSDAFERFMASTNVNYEQWHDGVGYDLEALAALDGADREEAKRFLLDRAGKDWRDLEGLLALGDEVARAAVVEQLRSGSTEQRLWAARFLPPDPTIEADREAAIVKGLEAADLYSGLSVVIDLAEAHRTPGVVDALFRAALRTDGTMAMHAAALLEYIHGLAKEPFDWERRPFYFQLIDADPAVRRAAFEQLCRECGVDPERYLRTDP